MDQLCGWFAPPVRGPARAGGGVTEGDGEPASPILGEPDHRGGVVVAMQSHRTSGHPDGIGGQHDVLGEAAAVEFVAPRLLDDEDGDRGPP